MNSLPWLLSHSGLSNRQGLLCATLFWERKKLIMNRKSFLCVVSLHSFLQPAGNARRLPPISLSANPAVIDLRELSALLATTGQNCLLFPKIHYDGTLDPVDPSKLQVALKNSMLVVSIHTSSDIPGDYMERLVENETQTNWLNPFLQPKSTIKKLVAFGRAMSDHSLTASIHDLAVAPSLQRLGLGRYVMKRLVRDLVHRGIWDIAVVVRPELRPFFEVCGFQPDALNSTTMVYTHTQYFSNKVDQSAKQYGRRNLLVPSSFSVRNDAIKQDSETDLSN